MATDERAGDPAQADRAWAGYHPRAALPALAVAAVASLVVCAGRWYQDDLSELAKRAGALAVYALAAGVWPVLGAAHLYRAATYTYRLTDRAVLIDFGFWHRPVAPVWLREVTEVRSGAGPVGRVLGVGWVEVRAAGRGVRLIGVRRPGALAAQIRAAATMKMTSGPPAAG